VKNIKPIIGIGVFLTVVYLCWMLVPPFFHQYQFNDFVDQKAKECTYAYNKTEDGVRQEVFREAREDSIPISQDQIKVEKSATDCKIAVAYTVHVDIPFFPQDFHFVAASQNANFLTK